jgi:hypothetical protein
MLLKHTRIIKIEYDNYKEKLNHQFGMIKKGYDITSTKTLKGGIVEVKYKKVFI